MRANYTRIIIGMEIKLKPRLSGGGSLEQTNDRWRFVLPAGTNRSYRLSQLDDYGRLARNRFLHISPWSMELRARVSAGDLPGTWGFGLWNDPFGLSLGFGGKPGRLPALPQVAWFMYASPPNWLSLQGDSGTNPGNGFFAGTFRSTHIPTLLLAPAVLTLPISIIRPISRALKRLADRIIHQDMVRVDQDVTRWHTYSIKWQVEGCQFLVDGRNILQTPVSPSHPLGLVLWIDNQFAAWTPEGRIRYGILANPTAWLEIERLEFS